VLLRFGEVVKTDLTPGLHFKTPFVNSVRKFDGRILTVDSTPERFFTQEQKQLIVDSYAKFRVVDTAKYYTATSGEEFRAAALLSQRINDDLRNQVAGRSVQEVVSGERDQLMEAVKARLNETVLTELGVEVIDVRVKKIDLPNEVSQSVYRRMNAEREKEARELRSEGKEIAEGMRAEADRKVTVIEAEAVRDAEIIRGDGDATATRIYADSFNRDPEFYAFTRSLNAYQQTFANGSDIMLLQPDSQFFQYLRDPKAGK
jgi:membrane protease subunit HflC